MLPSARGPRGLLGGPTPSARRLIVAYAALLALCDLSVLLPGNPYSSVWGFIGVVAVQWLIVWRLWHGSSLSWLFAMFFAAGYVVTIVLMQPTLEVGVALTFVFSIAQAVILWTRPIEALVSGAAVTREPLRQ
jgi:hypothetical protein